MSERFKLYNVNMKYIRNLHNIDDNVPSVWGKEMHRWWREKDFSDVLNEKRITSDMSMESIVTEIYRDVCSGE